MWRQNDSVLNTDHLGRMEKGISDTGGTGEIWSILIYLVMGMMFMCCNTFQDISIFWVINRDEKSKSSIILCLIMENKDSAIMLGFQILKLCFPDAVFRYPFIWIILRWNILPVFKFLTHREKKKKRLKDLSLDQPPPPKPRDHSGLSDLVFSQAGQVVGTSQLRPVLVCSHSDLAPPVQSGSNLTGKGSEIHKTRDLSIHRSWVVSLWA